MYCNISPTIAWERHCGGGKRYWFWKLWVWFFSFFKNTHVWWKKSPILKRIIHWLKEDPQQWFYSYKTAVNSCCNCKSQVLKWHEYFLTVSVSIVFKKIKQKHQNSFFTYLDTGLTKCFRLSHMCLHVIQSQTLLPHRVSDILVFQESQCLRIGLPFHYTQRFGRSQLG